MTYGSQWHLDNAEPPEDIMPSDDNDNEEETLEGDDDE